MRYNILLNITCLLIGQHVRKHKIQNMHQHQRLINYFILLIFIQLLFQDLIHQIFLQTLTFYAYMVHKNKRHYSFVRNKLILIILIFLLRYGN